jgi:hypothetical protein
MVRHELHVCRLPTIEAVLKGLCRKEGEGIDGVGDESKVQSSARCKALRMHFCFTSQSGNVHRELEERHTTNAIDSLNGCELARVAGDDLDSQSRWHMLRRGRLRHPVTTVPIFRVAVVPLVVLHNKGPRDSHRHCTLHHHHSVLGLLLAHALLVSWPQQKKER